MVSLLKTDRGGTHSTPPPSEEGLLSPSRGLRGRNDCQPRVAMERRRGTTTPPLRGATNENLEVLTMAYAILRTTKIKSHGQVTGSISHAERTRETKNADPEKLQDNVTYVKFDEEKFYNDVEANRTVKPPVDPKNPTAEELRNSNVIAIEMLLTASPEHFEGKSREDVLKWADDNVKFAKEKFGEDNVRNAILHLDEKTPHVTLMIIPLKEHGLSCKSWLGEKSDMRKMQTEYAQAMEPYGLKRGEKGSIAEHETIQEYYTKLEQIKAETLALNPEVKLEVKPDQLRDPSLKDKMNTTAYKAEVIEDTVGILQKQVDKLINQNKKLTTKLLTAEKTIDKQKKELTEHRDRADSTRDDLKAYKEVKDAIKQPDIAQAIHLYKNPHIGQYREFKAQKMNSPTIAYKMLLNGTKERDVRDAFQYDKQPQSITDNALTKANDAIAQEKAKVAEQARIAKEQAEQAKIQAQQAKVQAEIVQREHARIMKRREHIEKNPHVKKYLELASKGWSDEGIANHMMRKGFDKKDVVMAIATESPKVSNMSNEATVQARKIVNDVEKSIKGISKGKGGGMSIGGSGGRKVERDRDIESRPVGGGGMSVGRELSDDERIRQLMDKGMSEEMATKIVMNPEE